MSLLSYSSIAYLQSPPKAAVFVPPSPLTSSQPFASSSVGHYCQVVKVQVGDGEEENEAPGFEFIAEDGEKRQRSRDDATRFAFGICVEMK
ncbi:hypothetical protein LWI28_011498 [Acer negundo]|uniref:Uncharacterized protein n=1 Tax=Acer negundo TaxID=4023 RepID=A0AAD5J590_ACENE|nr:hypothetical protein LWI28_011498 [Acer negundo]